MMVVVDETNNNQWFAQDLIYWQQINGRNDLPWQQTRNVYRIWLSEIMLQQTQVATVIPYYQRFLKKFPTVRDLADAEQDVVMQYWSGLGYYARARNLHRCAKMVAENHGGIFPKSAAELEKLPGIGRSTAAAIAAFSYSHREAILDGNVIRVLARVFGITVQSDSPSGKHQFYQQAVSLLPVQHIEAYTQGLMDLGATVCTKGRPKCEKCPFIQRCVANKTEKITSLPVKKIRGNIPKREALFLFIVCGGHVLLKRRDDNGIWGGLYSPREWNATKDVSFAKQKDLLDDEARSFGQLQEIVSLPPFMHTFTHFKLQLHPYVAKYTSHTYQLATNERWFDLLEIEQIGAPTPIKKILRMIQALD